MMTNFVITYTGGRMLESETDKKEVLNAWEDKYGRIGNALVVAGSSFDPNAKGAGRVVLTNTAPGAVSLALEPNEVPGFELALDKTNIAQGQSAVLSIGYVPSKDRKPAPALVKIVVSPTQQVIPIRIAFTGSPAQ